MVESVFDVAVRSIVITGSSALLALAWSIPAAFAMASRRLEALASVFEAVSNMPTVVVGLLFYFLLSRQGPLGFLNLLYTPQAVILAQSVLATPIVVATAYRILRASYETYGEAVQSLGASDLQAFAAVVRESLPGLAGSAVIGFSRTSGELGVAMIVGGNIEGSTRVLTTAATLYVSIGEFEKALYAGLTLVLISVLVSAGTWGLRWRV